MRILVNGEPIPREAVQFELNRLIQFHSKHTSPGKAIKDIEVLKAKAIEQAIGAKLLINEADRLQIETPEDDIQDRLEDLIKKAGGREKYVAMMEKQGIDEKHVRDGIRRGRRVEILIEQITAGVQDPTEKEIEEHFNEHSGDYTREDTAHIQHVLIKPVSSGESDRDVARSKLQEIKRRIEDDGASFADMAAMFSDCPSGKQSGGSLGWISRGMLVPEMDETVFKMDDDELSDVFETSLGFHLVKKVASQSGGEVAISEVADKIREFLRHTRRGQALSAYVAGLREKANVDITE